MGKRIAWEKPVYVNDWHSYWTLTEKKLQDGEKVKVRFSNKNIQRGTMRIVRGEHQGSGGMSELYSWEETFVDFNYHGNIVSIALNQTKIELARA